jgi:hypothetical protein
MLLRSLATGDLERNHARIAFLIAAYCIAEAHGAAVGDRPVD